MEVLQWSRQHTAPMTPADAGRVTAEPVPVAFIGRTSTLALQDPRASLRRQLRSAQDWLPARLVHRRRLLGHRVRRHRPGTPQPGRRLAGSSPTPGCPATAAWPTCSPKPPPRAPVRRRGLRGHRTVRPGHVQRPETGKGTLPAGHPAIRHRRARRHRRRQRHHRTGPPGQARRRGMVPAPVQGKDLERAGRAFPGRVEHRHPALRVRRRADPAPGPVQGRPGPHQIPAHPRPGPRPRHRADLHLADRGQARLPGHRRPAQRRPRRLPAAEPGAPGGPRRTSGSCSPTPSTPGTWSTAGTAPATAAAPPSRQTSGSGHPPPSTPPSWTGPPGTPPRTSPPGTAPAATATSLNTHPATPRFYPYRSRVRCRDCRRRMTGTTYGKPGAQSTYYRCPHDPATPKHAADHPDHPRTVQAPELLLDQIVGRFFADPHLRPRPRRPARRPAPRHRRRRRRRPRRPGRRAPGPDQADRDRAELQDPRTRRPPRRPGRHRRRRHARPHPRPLRRTAPRTRTARSPAHRPGQDHPGRRRPRPARPAPARRGHPARPAARPQGPPVRRLRPGNPVEQARPAGHRASPRSPRTPSRPSPPSWTPARTATTTPAPTSPTPASPPRCGI